MQIGDYVIVKTEGIKNRIGKILAIEPEPFKKSKMYLIILEDFPIGIWFFEEMNNIKKYVN
ncbi:hypothetical protein [Candidatus Pantoea edessiphila]|uniref:Uncharacterized protein n=1 Tax=Candidatus Pantoea edessiphila TaxID=2044610 RepID=A0A2P5SWM8_9GAMM|nr:hypothetical protein [Candidatus Pantoea edessiphila]PPI86747.1 hypothetical protein CRV10_00615 [Candidatus Pantoea edessiphila]